MVISAILAVVLNLSLLQAAGATSICRWIDENGQTQFSDVVPESYKPVVTCTHSQKIKPSAEQRTVDGRSNNRLDKPSPPAASPRQSAASVPATKQFAETVTERTNCTTWRRLYDESGACFAPFRTVRGGIKAEAFAVCNEVPNPEAKCGPPTN